MTTPVEKMVRSFIAIPVPSEGIEALQEAVKSFEPEIGGFVRWVRAEGIHLTLKFMGDIPAGTVERVLKTLPPVAARFSTFKLSLSGLGVFPNARSPRVLWAGLDGELEVLSALQLAIDDALGELGLPKEQRAFSPHLTLGRVRRGVPEGQLRKIGEIVAGPISSRLSATGRTAELPAAPSWSADTVNLMRTVLDPAGSRHYLVGSAPIGGE